MNEILPPFIQFDSTQEDAAILVISHTEKGDSKEKSWEGGLNMAKKRRKRENKLVIQASVQE